MQHIIIPLVLCLSLNSAEISGNPKLLFANRKDIRVIDVQKGKISKSILVKDVNDAASVDYYFRKQEVCWTDIGKEFIKCVSLNGTNERSKDLKEIKVINRGVASPDGMAIDWLTEKLYWADSESDKIEVAELYGPYRKLLYWEGLDQPRAIALVPSEGFMFWSDWGESPKIERAGMNGDSSTRKILIDQDILWPNGLTIDYESRRIFWADGKLYSISCVDFDGLNRIKVIEKLKHPFALTYFKESLYWTDWSTESIHYCHLNSEMKCENINQLNVKLSPMYIHVYDQSRQLHKDTPCHHQNGGCSHLCLLSPASSGFTCACPTGVKLKDNFICEKGPNEMLLLARRSDLRRISLDTPDLTPVVLPVSNVRHAIAVDYDPVEQFFYWTDDEAFWIQRARLNGSDQEILIHSEGLDSDGVAIDWLARNLYWSDTENNRIEVAKLDGTSRKILLRGGLDKPRAIALFPEGGLMFWTDWGSNPKIERSNLDGSDRITIVNTKLGWPNGVAVDFLESRVYWVDASTRVIEMAELDGSNRQVILGENLPHVFGFSLLGDFLYWTDWQKRSIERVHKHNNTYREILVDQLPDVMGLKALSVHQKMGFSPCMNSNGGCSHLCFNKPNEEFVCDCPLGLELTSNGKDCIVPTAYLLYTQHEDIRRVSLGTFMDFSLPMPGIKQPSTFDYDSSGRLYWSDISSKMIFRSFMNGSQPEVVIEFGLGYPEGLAVDWLANNLYWSDMVKNRIEVSKLDGTSRRVLLWNVTQPKSLAVNPLEGFMYWSEWPNEDQKIMRSYLDGTWPKVIVNKDVGRVSGLTIDYSFSRLYWIDIDKKRIESSLLDGQDRKVVIENLFQPNGLALFEDFIYWSDWQKQVIHKADKVSGDNVTVVKRYPEFVTDLLIVRSAREESANPCFEGNGNCSHLCIALPSSNSQTNSFTCSCPTHYSLQEDEKTCLPPQNFIIFSQKSSATRLLVDTNECPTLVLPLPNMRNVRAVAFDVLRNDVFWIDGKAQTIRKASDSGLNSQIIMKKDKIDPFDLVVDSGSQLVFWSCSSNNVINVTRMDGLEVGTIFGMEGNDQPRSLEIHSKLGLLFFTNFVSPPVIEKLILSGLSRETIIRDKLRAPSSVAVDEDSIYWIDYSPTSIEVADLNGRNRRIIIDSHLNHPDDLTVHGNYIYWIDNELNLIERVNKYTGQERTKILNKIPPLTSIISVSANLFKTASNNPCLDEGVKCSHLCVVRQSIQKHMTSYLMPLENLMSYTDDLVPKYHQSPGSDYHCECPQELVLSTNEFTCVQKPICPPKHFTCLAAQTCIPMQWRCDGLKECSDGSDEMNCSPLICDQSLFRCANGHCIDNNFVCDRTAHCTDESDELDCCHHGQSMCKATGVCVPCSNPEQCPGGMLQCPFPMPFIPGESGTESKTIWFICLSILFFIIVVALFALFYYCRRKPTMLDDHEMETQEALKGGQSRPYRVVLTGGKVYTGVRGVVAPNCSLNAHMRVGLDSQALPDLCPDVVNVGGSRGVYMERTPVIGGASSSSSSLTHYPRETMNPPPTPVAEPRLHCMESHCCYPPQAAPPTSLNSYRHYKSHNRPPPPTPCSTDLCEDSDFYSSVIMSPHNSHCFSPASTCYSSPPPTDYDSDPYPPPPTPQTQYGCDLTSCPPSPSTDRSYFIQGPCPSPLSPSLSE